MGFNKDQAHELLQVVNDSYTRTKNLKTDYKDYQRLLRKENDAYNPISGAWRVKLDNTTGFLDASCLDTSLLT